MVIRIATPAVNQEILSKPSGGEAILKNKKTIIPSINPNNEIFFLSSNCN